MSLKKLFTPGQIGSVVIKNRIIMAAMGTGLATEDGNLTKRQIDYYVARAQGGTGLITTEAAYTRLGYPNRVYIGHDKFIPGWKRLVDAIHEAGAKVALQIATTRGRQDQVEPVSASESYHPFTGVKARALRTEEVEEIVAKVGEAALRARRSGFDAVNLHMGHGYLVSDFLCPLVNKRTDRYGGSLENRARFATELVESAKQKAGKDYPIIVRISVDSRFPGGFSLTDGIAVCQMLEKAGADAISVVSGVAETYEWAIPPMYAPPGYNLNLAKQIKKTISIPVTVAGRITDPHLCEEILQQRKADFIELGRALIADPEFPRKAMEGKIEDIRKCLGCLQCLDHLFARKPIRCTVNAEVGRERELRIEAAAKVKKMLVVGGGPGGMEAARVAALRGHEVVIWEKSDKLGGQLDVAAKSPCKGEIINLKDYLSSQIEKLSVEVKLGMLATPASVVSEKADAVVVATGSKPLIPKIPGAERGNVVTASDVLTGKLDTGRTIVVIGGGMVGCETADFLASKGKMVTIVEILEACATDVPLFINRFLLRRLRDSGVRMLTGVKPEEITEKGVRIVDKQEKGIFLEADSIVVATGASPNNELYRALQGKVAKLYGIGDCVRPRRIIDAIDEGASVGRQI